ncbi:hypothetical protein Vau01_096690 [Virgisporangium aurantiacum]|uniref:Uncharacterized protein n=1 Tax=Virgisporangium aurantiacum TaxID=175570 RepID=A0A8J3ZIR8_9ACTN|nr:hypothetical protein Vau01_096690 [Virgisporangium aurantiacum]
MPKPFRRIAGGNADLGKPVMQRSAAATDTSREYQACGYGGVTGAARVRPGRCNGRVTAAF